MSDETPIEEIIEEPIELSEQDMADIQKMIEEQPPYSTVLEVWRTVLSGIPAEAEKKVTPTWASYIVQTHPQLTMQEMAIFHALYFDKMKQLSDVLDFEISTDEECLKRTTQETDSTENAIHYKNLLRDWQACFLQWELDWDCVQPDSHIEVAAISEVHKMFFSSDKGIVGYLEHIGFEFTEEDQAELHEALNEMKVGHSE